MLVQTKSRELLRSLLPAYVNGSISPVQKRLVALWLSLSSEARSEVARMQALDTALEEQKLFNPSAAVQRNIMLNIRRIHAEGRSRSHGNRAIWVTTVVMVLLAAVLFVRAMPPGVVLHWTTTGDSPDAFRIYRAPVANEGDLSVDEYSLLSELPSDIGTSTYSFVDLRLLPGQNYVYRVEALDPQGRLTTSQTIVGSGYGALPGQLALLLTLTVISYIFWRFSTEYLDKRRELNWA